MASRHRSGIEMTTTGHGRNGLATLAAAVAMVAVYPTFVGAAPEEGRDLVRLAQASPAPAASSPKTGTAGSPKKATGSKAPATEAPAAQGAGDAGLRQRVEALEEQLVDLQVVIGTLESLARAGGGSGAGAAARPSVGGSASDQARLDGIETQIRALTAQMEQLNGAPRQGGAAPAAGSRRTDVAGFRAPEPVATGGFGSTTVTPGNGDAIGGLLNGQAQGGAEAGGGAPPATRQQAAVQPPPQGASEPGAKQLYETAYGHLLQQDYGAAEAAFDDFLKRYPADGLAGNAQYWLGESHYVRGQYKAAASAFLKGYQSYGKSAKASDSLLKLAMSLDRLGQKDAACSSYNELGSKFPNAPAHVKARAQSERQRIGCP
jgi:tol-pal system protein YbgF